MPVPDGPRRRSSRRPSGTVLSEHRDRPAALRARLVDGPRIAVSWSATYRARAAVLIVTGRASGPPRPTPLPGSRVIGSFVRPP